MGIAERKQRAFEAREKLVIEEADTLLLDRGYLGLNLDELAERVEYSKATLYHHFISKEDLVLAVVTRHMEIRSDIFRRAREFEGLTRERMFAFGIGDRILSQLFPHGFPLVQLVRSPSIWGKCSEARQQKYFEATEGCFSCAMSVAGEAKERGDFAPWSPPPEQVVWGLVSLSKGAHLLTEESLFHDDPGMDSPLEFLFSNYHHYLDGVGWRPSSREHDYYAAKERIENEVFAEEMKSVT